MTPSADDAGGVEADGVSQVYRAVSRRADLDALHDVIVRHGLEALAWDVPYLVVAARNQTRSRARTDSRRATPVAEVPEPPEAALDDPLDLAVQGDMRRRLLLALAQLPDEDVIVVWYHANGYSDREIQQGLVGRGASADLTVEAIRKRRQRAHERLRSLLHTSAGEQP